MGENVDTTIKMKEPKRALVLTLLLSLMASFSAVASESGRTHLADAYFGQQKDEKRALENRKFLQDECFVKANEFIYNPNKQKEISFNQGDPHKPEEQVKVTTKVADYDSALKALYACVAQSGNPVAAWEGLYIINTYTAGVLASKKIEEYRKFSEVLYNDQSCDGYLHYGDVFGKGIGTKPNKDKALKIYKQGLEVCDQSWHNMVIQMRINYIGK